MPVRPFSGFLEETDPLDRPVSFFDLQSLPPTSRKVGGRDVLLDDSIRLYAAHFSAMAS
jgi:hypothetical protein